MLRKSTVSTKMNRQWQGIPGIERAANGRLWCCFFSGGPKEPHSDNTILLATSEDDGQTWAEAQRIVSPPGPTRAYDPALWHDTEGRLWLFYNLANTEQATFALWAMTTQDSALAQPRWSAPQRIDIPAPYAFRLNKPTVLSTGEWLLPVTWAQSAPEGWFVREGQLQGVARSADRGRSWHLHGRVEAPVWALENMIVERQDGVLWMLIRTGAGVLWQSFSHDRGQTWSEGSATEIVNPGARFFVRRLASGRLLLINTPHPQERTGLFAYLSEPGSDANWGAGLELDDREKVSYPDAVQAPDGTIYAVHDRDRYGVGEINLCRFTEQDVLAASVLL